MQGVSKDDLKSENIPDLKEKHCLRIAELCPARKAIIQIMTLISGSLKLKRSEACLTSVSYPNKCQ
jgi:hypothetical protein